MKVREQLNLTATALALTFPTLFNLISTNNIFAISIGALAAMLAGFVFVCATVQHIEQK
jgi:hypothetical protein